MGLFYLLLAAVGESGGYIFDRLNFKKNRISFRHLMLLSFLGMSVFILAYILLVRQPDPLFSPAAIFVISLIIGLSFLGNVFDSLSLKNNDLSLREPLVDFSPILAGLVGFALFPDERSTEALFAFFAGLAIYWGMHRIRLGRLQRRGIWFLLLSTVFYALLPSLYKEALNYFSPAYISAFRVVGILVLVSLFLRPKPIGRGLNINRVWYSIASGAFCSVAAIAGIYAIQVYGVVLTMLFLMLGPALRYLAGQFILREKVRRAEVISSILLSVIVGVTAFV